VIVVAGLSPAWQQIVELDQFEPGEVNRARRVTWCASGKVVNVGIGLQRLGANATVCTVLGGPTGALLEDDLRQTGTPLRAFGVRSPTRVCTTILDGSCRSTTELVENAGSVTPEELGRFIAMVHQQLKAASALVLTGSVPSGCPATVFCDLAAAAACPILIDGQGELLRESLAIRPWIVKPNRRELAAALGRPLSSDGDLAEAISEIHSRGAQGVVVSNGPEAIWASLPDGRWRLLPPRIELVNPIGSGDVMAAVLAWSIGQNLDAPTALRWAVAAGGLNASTLIPGRFDTADLAKWAEAVECVPW
jgi:1-phosphofructokinase family hexose kinase